MRVHEIAKELGLTSKVLLTILAKLNIEAKSHSSSISDEDVKKVKSHLQGMNEAKERKEKKSIKEKAEPALEEPVLPEKKQVPIALEEPLPKKEEAPKPELTVVEIENEVLTVKEFALLINVPVTQILTALLKKGLMMNLNQNIDMTLAEEIAGQFNIALDIKAIKKTDQQKRVEDVFLAEIEEEERFLKERPPIVTVMGHVDHGKTKLLDAIRKTNVVDREAGGITQHIGAYQVHVHGKDITFIDTPGHEAFTEIRARGATITDVVILVVAADDGIMPQTIEAINHAKAAKVPIIVAINKIDKPEANIDRVKQQLTEYDMVPEEWGGKTVVVPVSAKEGKGIKELLEMILLVSEMEELKANPHKKAVGIILESHLSKNKGPIATVLIKSGTLRVGNPFVIGHVFGKVRAITDDSGKTRKDATPSLPVEIMGLSDVPNVGDVMQVVSSEKEAKNIAEERRHEVEDDMRKKKKAMTLEDFSQKISEGEITTVNLIIKADVIGSLEAILSSIAKIKVENTTVNVVHSSTGIITESDVMLAKASQSIILGFNVALPMEIKNKAEEDGIVIKLYNIIYKLIDELNGTLKGLLKPTYERVMIGVAEVRSLFKFSKVGVIAGCYVTEGKAVRNSEVEIFRDNNMIFQGKLTSLKRFKDDVKEVQMGYECGIVLDGFNEYKEGDRIHVFALQEITK
ncbi:MAG: translation initiation factor IF-2 [Candidatus Margulisbacteria bacterium]|nr:translation initiation factor IF-2 [Candidatus Margulisiibacteriota bacterium]